MSVEGIKEMLEGPHCSEAVKTYVEERVRLRYQVLHCTAG